MTGVSIIISPEENPEGLKNTLDQLVNCQSQIPMECIVVGTDENGKIKKQLASYATQVFIRYIRQNNLEPTQAIEKAREKCRYTSQICLIQNSLYSRPANLPDDLEGIIQNLKPVHMRHLITESGPRTLRDYQKIKYMALDLFAKGEITEPARLVSNLPEEMELTRSEKRSITQINGCSKSTWELPKLESHSSPIYTSIHKKILYIAANALPFHRTGYSIRTQGLLKQIKNNGFDVICLIRPGYPEDRSDVLKKVNKNKYTIDGVSYKHIPNGPDRRDLGLYNYFLQASEAIEREARKEKPSVIHAASNHENAVPALMAARRLGLQFVYEVRGLWEWTAAANNPGWDKTERFSLAKSLESFAATNADMVFTLSQALADELVARGVKRECIHLLPNAVDTGRFSPRPKDKNLVKQLNLAKADLTIVYAGTLNFYEGLDDLLGAVKILGDKQHDIRCLIIGQGKAYNELARHARELGITGCVTFVDEVSPEEVPRYLSLADLAVFARKPYKVCELVPPLKPLEAMAMGKPVVVSDLPVMREIVEHEKTGLLFEPGGKFSLAECLEKLLNQNLLKSLGRKARKTCEEYFSAKEMGRRVRQGYEAIEWSGSSKRGTGQMIKLVREPFWKSFQVQEQVPCVIEGNLVYSDYEDAHSKSCLVRIRYYDENKKEIPGPYLDVSKSSAVGYYCYIISGNGPLLNLSPPKGAVKLALGFQQWNAKGDIFVNEELSCKQVLKKKTVEFCDDQSTLLSKKDSYKKSLKELKIAVILDEFTLECFKYDVELIPFTPWNWKTTLEKNKPDLLFVESCWFGNKSSWNALINNYTANGTNYMDELINVINFCRDYNIPTVFWNKEDPVSYDKFGPTAAMFDYVFTSDEKMISKYKKDWNIKADSLCFFCQPKIHNPEETIKRQNKAMFAGTYYEQKEERCNDFNRIMQAIEKTGIDYDIYDRCYYRELPHFKFPDRYHTKIVGCLPPEDMWKAYKGYNYTINLNSVKHSPTMFARRVYESLASGTPVISNYSEGVITQFGGIVCASDDIDEITTYLEKIKNESVYKEAADKGKREVLGRHTLADRLQKVCKRIGIDIKSHLPHIYMIVDAFSESDITRALQIFKSQTYNKKRLVVNLKNILTQYHYLNKSSDNVIYRADTEFKESFDDMEINIVSGKDYAHTYLEDLAIKTQYEKSV